ncbi:surface-adhesin E family protein [Psychrobacter immobilis]|uniref:surface-adhesin E family protein n=1 Tax=Psychrobacter immobilis TaxID=498 RepID=UPI001919C43B|nr:surface-adhesin E family protein [Psychrobacter immobilis]
MRKIIVCSLACLISVSANATNWIKTVTDKQGVISYIDTDSIKIINENTQIVTAFFRYENLSKAKKIINNKVVDSTSSKIAFNCESESSYMLSGIFYDSNGANLDSFSRSIDGSFSSFGVIHPDTLGYADMYAACAIAGFKNISDL